MLIKVFKTKQKGLPEGRRLKKPARKCEVLFPGLEGKGGSQDISRNFWILQEQKNVAEKALNKNCGFC